MGVLNIRSLIAVCSVILLFYFISFGCTGDNTRRAGETEVVPGDLYEDSQSLTRVKQIFHALPSPLETAMLLKSAGAVYDDQLLNPAGRASDYVTSRSMALNLGIYSANLSYASLFDQTQTCIRYMNAAKQLADNLGIIDAIDSYTMDRLEENLNNRDVIIDIVSETFMNASSFLQENNREPVAAMMFLGGWIEGLFLAVNLVDESNMQDDPLVRRIVDNKLSLEIMMSILEENSYNDDVKYLIGMIERLNPIFQNMDLVTTPPEVDTTPGDPVTILRSRAVYNIDDDLFRELKSAVNEIRNSFVS